MELSITFEKAEWNKSKYGNGKVCVVVRFPNCDFRWMPTYKQLEDIKRALDEVEVRSWNLKYCPFAAQQKDEVEKNE